MHNFPQVDVAALKNLDTYTNREKLLAALPQFTAEQQQELAAKLTQLFPLSAATKQVIRELPPFGAHNKQNAQLDLVCTAVYVGTEYGDPYLKIHAVDVLGYQDTPGSTDERFASSDNGYVQLADNHVPDECLDKLATHYDDEARRSTKIAAQLIAYEKKMIAGNEINAADIGTMINVYEKYCLLLDMYAFKYKDVEKAYRVAQEIVIAWRKLETILNAL